MVACHSGCSCAGTRSNAAGSDYLRVGNLRIIWIACSATIRSPGREDIVDVGHLRAECAQYHPEYPVLGVAYEPYYLYCRLRGIERALEDVIANPDFADALMDRIHALFEAIVGNSIEAAGDLFDFVYVAEDLGTQESLLMSPRAIRRFILPRLAKMAEMVHAAGKRVFHHDDGAIRPVLPDLLRIGIDILNPIQWRCKGMEREALARDFGGVVFHGGVDNQHTLPFGSREDVRHEVGENIRIFRQCKGYVVAPVTTCNLTPPPRTWWLYTKPLRSLADADPQAVSASAPVGAIMLDSST